MRVQRAVTACAIVLAAAAAAGCGTDATAGLAVRTASGPVTTAAAASPAQAVAPAAATVPAKTASGATRGATPASSPATVPGSFSWKEVFHDDFNGTSLGKHWFAYNSPRAKTPRTPQSVRVRNGYLDLIAHYQSPYGYVGGGVGYWPDQTYGRWVMRFRADAGAGSEPVILLWPAGPWPTDGEVDILGIYSEYRHGGGIYLIMGSVGHHAGHSIPTSVDFTKWHTMAVDWLPSHLTFWLDGKAIWTIRRASGGANFVPDTPFHLAIQLDAGCDNGCKPNSKTPPQVHMQVDWVKIYKAS